MGGGEGGRGEGGLVLNENLQKQNDKDDDVQMSVY